MAPTGPEVARHLEGETKILRQAVSETGLAEVAAIGIIWVDSDPPLVLRAYAATSELLEQLADMYPDGPADLWLPEDWESSLPLPAVSRARQRTAAAARLELRAAGVPARDVPPTVLRTLAKSLNDDPGALEVPTAACFFTFASDHEVDETLFDVLRRDVSPQALQWLEERHVLRFADPYP